MSNLVELLKAKFAEHDAEQAHAAAHAAAAAHAETLRTLTFEPITLEQAHALCDADELSERVRIVNYSQCVELIYIANGAYEYALIVTYDNNDGRMCIVSDDHAIFTRERMRAAYQIELSAHDVSFDEALKLFYPFALTLV